MIRHRPPRALLAAILLTMLVPMAPGPNPAPENGKAEASPLPSRSFFGMNLYITGLERPKDERLALLSAARDLGVRWSREEMSWANLEPDHKGVYNWGAYDPSIDALAQDGVGTIGSLQTSPSWASGVK